MLAAEDEDAPEHYEPAEEILAEREKWCQRDWKATMVHLGFRNFTRQNGIFADTI